MALSVSYGQNVKASIQITNTGKAGGRFRLQGKIIAPPGTEAGNFWNKLVKGDPLKAAELVAQAGAVNYVDAILVAGGATTAYMYTAPLWAEPGTTEATALHLDVKWTLTCLDTNEKVERLDRDVFFVVAPITNPVPYIRDVVYSVA